MASIEDIRETLHKKAVRAAEEAAQIQADLQRGINTLNFSDFVLSLPLIISYLFLAMLAMATVWYFTYFKWKRERGMCPWMRSLKHPFPAPKKPSFTLGPLVATILSATLSSCLIAVKERELPSFTSFFGIVTLIPTTIWPLVAFQMADVSLTTMCSIGVIVSSIHAAYLHSEYLRISTYVMSVPIVVHVWLFVALLRIVYEMEMKALLRKARKGGDAKGMAAIVATLIENTDNLSKPTSTLGGKNRRANPKRFGK